MREFGKSRAIGRRGVPRVDAPSWVTVSSSDAEFDAAMLDISRTGACLCGGILPSIGERVALKAGNMHLFADAVWLQGNRCGIEFEAPLTVHEVKELAWLGKQAAA
jgi:hypothetical protein